MNAVPVCPGCDSVSVWNLGEIPTAINFAGRNLANPIPGGCLWRCGTCYLAFRWPRGTKAELDELYVGGATDSWESSEKDRRDWQIAAEWLRQELPENASILDIGCFDGGFLAGLSGRYRRYGIEIHSGARARAEVNGISIVGRDFADSALPADFVDCVTAFDVIEHVHHPADFLERCARIVRPGGLVILSSGNTDALSFRFMGAAYWYCAIAEHLSFISPRWIEYAVKPSGLMLKKQMSFSHRANTARFLPELCKNIVYRYLPRLFARLRRAGFGKKPADKHPELAAYPPLWTASTDHFIALLQKN